MFIQLSRLFSIDVEVIAWLLELSNGIHGIRSITALRIFKDPFYVGPNQAGWCYIVWLMGLCAISLKSVLVAFSDCIANY